MKKIVIKRFYSGSLETLGFLTVMKSDNLFGIQPEIIFNCFTLELADKQNKALLSCIPAGIYMVRKRYSKKHKSHLEVLNVPDRTNILIHAGNFYTDITGCIIVGEKFKDIDKDGALDVVNSRKTLKKLLKCLGSKEDFVTLKIINGDEFKWKKYFVKIAGI